MFIYRMHKSTSKLENRIFLVAVDGGWSDWSQWSHCTKNVNGIQMRTRQCVNPKPQFGGKLCTGPQCNSYEGMHRHIQMPSRYWANFKEEVCLLSYPSGLSHDQYRSQLTYQRNFWPHYCLLARSPRVIEVLTQHARHASEIKRKKNCLELF